jgi:hypothetical protein
MLIGIVSCGMFTAVPPAHLPGGWSCEDMAPQKGWRCTNEAHRDDTALIIELMDSGLDVSGDALGACSTQSIGVGCMRTRHVIGPLYADAVHYTVGDVVAVAQLNGPRNGDPSATWSLADELLPQVRFHAVEAVCQRETGKPCEVTFGPMELQPNGDPRAVAK